VGFVLDEGSFSEFATDSFLKSALSSSPFVMSVGLFEFLKR
jgi:hypothetical protein